MYRGAYNEWTSAHHSLGERPMYLRGDLPVYFTDNPDSAEVYGAAVKYETLYNLNLVDMGDLHTVQALLNSARSPELKKSITKAFRVSNGIVKRVSKIKYDIHVAEYICRLGYDGYYAPRLPGKYSSESFHPEFVLCRARDVLRVYGIERQQPPPTRTRIGVNQNIREAVARMNYSHH